VAKEGDKKPLTDEDYERMEAEVFGDCDDCGIQQTVRAAKDKNAIAKLAKEMAKNGVKMGNIMLPIEEDIAQEAKLKALARAQGIAVKDDAPKKNPPKQKLERTNPNKPQEGVVARQRAERMPVGWICPNCGMARSPRVLTCCDGTNPAKHHPGKTP
jgi:hypothetical protein